jgi:hypothetical protein
MLAVLDRSVLVWATVDVKAQSKGVRNTITGTEIDPMLISQFER